MANQYPLSYVSSNLQSMLAEMVNQYSDKLSEKAEKITEQIAKDFAEELKQATPRSNYAVQEHLADSVEVTEKTQRSYGRKGKVCYVHYRKWNIAHLLEFGWVAKNGKRVTRTPFVRPLFDKNRERYYRMYKEGLQ